MSLQTTINNTVAEINRLQSAGYNTRALEIHLQSLLRQKAEEDMMSRKHKKANTR